MARPFKKVDEELIYTLATYHAPIKDIARVIECSESLLESRYKELIAKGRSDTRNKLRQKQIQLALEGDRGLLIWLGKVMLQQVEYQPEELKQIKEILIKIDPSRAKTDDTKLTEATTIDISSNQSGQDNLPRPEQ